MRDAVGLVGRLDEEFAHASDEMPLRVVRLGAHQLSGINLHGTASFPATGRVASEPANKNPAHRKGRPRGKHLIQMDFPLARREPSPPDRGPHRIYPAPHPARCSGLYPSPATS